MGIGASALAMACSFGAIDGDEPIQDVAAPPATGASTDLGAAPAEVTPGVTAPVTSPSTAGDPQPAYDPDNDPFSTEKGQEVLAILSTNCGGCHANGAKSGDMDYILNVADLIKGGKVIPGTKEDSQIWLRMSQNNMPPNYITQRPTEGQIQIVGQFIDELPVTEAPCEPLPFLSYNDMVLEMSQDIRTVDETAQPFTRYLTVAYSSNGGQCGRVLDRQRYSLFKGINSISTNARITTPVAIDADKLIYRIDIRDYNWDRAIDLEDDGVVDFNDGWDAITDKAGPYAVEFAGDQADDLKADTGTLVPFLPVNAFIQVTETDDLYYTLIGAKANLFDFEKQVLGVDTAVEIANDNLMRAGFANSGVSEQERVLNRFDTQLGSGYAYWISFDFDGGNGGDGGGDDFNRANESIYSDPIGFNFAGGEAIFNLPNGLQAYYVANTAGKRLGEAPVGVVIDPAQNNGVVVNGASCHTCHQAGMITFTDTVKQYVLDNKVEYNNEDFERVMAIYPDKLDFQAQMDLDSKLHVSSVEKTGIPPKTPDAISRVFLEFQLGNLSLELAAGELGVSSKELNDSIGLLDPRFGVLKNGVGYLNRDLFTDLFTDALCILQGVSDNAPLNCP